MAEVEKIRKNHGETTFCKVDVTKEEEVKNMVDFTVKTYGRLDVAINNAARTPDDKPLAELDINEFDKVMDVDIRGVACV